VHSGQPNLNLRLTRKALSGLEGLLKIVDLEIKVESVGAGTYSESCRERIQIVGAELM